MVSMAVTTMSNESLSGTVCHVELETKVHPKVRGLVSIVSYKPPVPCDNCVGVPISRLLTVGSTPV